MTQADRLDSPGRSGTVSHAGPGAARYGLIVIAVAALWIGVVPLLNHVLKYDDPIKPGQALLIAPGITFKPVPGWNLETGLRTTDKTRTHAEGSPATLTHGAIKMKVEPVSFDGSPRSLLRGVERLGLSTQGETLHAVGDRFPLVARGTDDFGIAQYFNSPSGEGLIGVFVFGQTGVVLSIVGPAVQMDDQGDEIGKMLISFRYDEAKAGSGGDGK